MTDSTRKGNKIQRPYRSSSPSKGMEVKKVQGVFTGNPRKPALAEQQDTHGTQIGVERSAGMTTDKALDVTLRDVY